jgi:HrpA-like RNA helicase
MDVSQLILHSLSFAASDSVDSLHFLLNAPDPPTNGRLLQALAALADQGHIVYDSSNPEHVRLTQLGKLASSFPVPPRITRMLVTALLLRCIDPALQIAALLSVPQVFSATPQSFWNYGSSRHTSDAAKMLELYQEFLTKKGRERALHPFRVNFQQVSRVHQQLEYAMRRSLEKIGPKLSEEEWKRWNSNSHRIAACVGIICCASTHIAHLMHADCFATRDRLGDAKMHPSSVNRDVRRRAHWYLYQELRTTKEPYLHITTAASPLDLALFSEPSSLGNNDECQDEWHFVVDQWVPVKVKSPEQCESLLKLRHLLTYDLLQRIAQDRKSVLEDKITEELVLHVLSAIELQRVQK